MPSLSKLERLWTRIDRWADPTSTHAVRLALGIALFGGVTVVSAFSFGGFELRPGWALALLPLATLSVLINVLEYRVAAGATAHSVGFDSAMRVAVTGSAANLLPLPGAALARVQGLRVEGVSTRQAIGANVVVGLAWLGISGLAAAAAMIVSGALTLSLGTATVAMAFLTTGWWLSNRRLMPDAFPRALVIEILFVLVATARFYVASRAVGFDSTPEQSLVTPLAGAAASAAGILPGGLGVRELLASLLGLAVGIPASAAALAASFDRIGGIVVLAGSAGVVAIHNRRSQEGAT